MQEICQWWLPQLMEVIAIGLSLVAHRVRVVKLASHTGLMCSTGRTAGYKGWRTTVARILYSVSEKLCYRFVAFTRLSSWR